MNFNVLFGTNVFFYICLDIYSVNDQLNYYYHATGIYMYNISQCIQRYDNRTNNVQINEIETLSNSSLN